MSRLLYQPFAAPTQRPLPLVAAGVMMAAQVIAAPDGQYQAYAAPPVIPVSGMTGQMGAVVVLPATLTQVMDEAAPPFSAPVVQVYGWNQGDYPDAAPGPRQPVREGGRTAALSPVFPVRELSWAPEYPDPIRSRVRPQSDAVYPAYAALSQVIPLSWSPEYPDRPVRLPVPPRGWFAKSDVQTSVPTLVAWQAEYVDQILTRKRAAESVLTAVLDRLAAPHAWDAVYPAFARGRARTPDYPAWAGPLDRLTVATDWDTTYPDLLLPVRKSAAEGAVAVLLDRLSTPTAWAPEYADQILRPRLAPPTFRTYPLSPAVPPPSLSWAAEYPDRAPGRQPLSSWQTLAFYPFPVTITVDQYAWRGRYPDAVWRPKLPEFPAWTSGATASTFPVATYAWRPTCPDMARRARFALEAQRWFDLHPFPIPVPTNQYAWRGQYPDWLPTRRPVEFPAFATGLTASSIPVVALSWQGEYPDSARAAARVLAPPFLTFDVFPRAVVTLVPVQTLDPVRAPRLVLPFAVETLTQATTSLLQAWLAHYADWLPVTTRRQASVQAVTFHADVVPTFAWRPAYPDPVRIAARLQPAPYAVTYAATDVSSFAWRGQYPDFARAKARVDPQPQHVIVPFRIFVPLSWGPKYPDRVWRFELLTAQQQAFAHGTDTPLRTPLVWQGRYADFARGVVLPVACMPSREVSPSVSAFSVVVPLSWLGRYADFARAFAPINVGPALAFVRLVVFGPGTMCFTEELVRQALTFGDTVSGSSWTTETANAADHAATYPVADTTQPSFASESVTQPRFTADESEHC